MSALESVAQRQRRRADAPAGPPRGVRTMAIVRWVLVLVTALVALGSILHFAGVRLGGSAERARRGQLYYCPMHPSVVQDHPGECPICSMTLVPKPAAPAPCSRRRRRRHLDGSGAGARGRRSDARAHPAHRDEDRRRQARGARRRAAHGRRRRSRTSAAWRRSRRASAAGSRSCWCRETGERVRRGQALATIYSPDVLRAEQELLVARGWSAGAPERRRGRARARRCHRRPRRERAPPPRAARDLVAGDRRDRRIRQADRSDRDPLARRGLRRRQERRRRRRRAARDGAVPGRRSVERSG